MEGRKYTICSDDSNGVVTRNRKFLKVAKDLIPEMPQLITTSGGTESYQENSSGHETPVGAVVTRSSKLPK